MSLGGRSAPTLLPDAEHACVLRLARSCRELLGTMPEPCAAHSTMKSDSCITGGARSSCAKHDRCRISSVKSVGSIADSCKDRSSPPSAGSAEGMKGPECSEAKFGCDSSALSEPASCNRQTLGVRYLPEHLVSRASQVAASPSQDSWRSKTHMQMAVAYRMQRTLLLQRVAADLECQSVLVSGRLTSPGQVSW